jgi:hypothetical protein
MTSTEKLVKDLAKNGDIITALEMAEGENVDPTLIDSFAEGILQLPPGEFVGNGDPLPKDRCLKRYEWIGPCTASRLREHGTEAE